MFSKYDEGVELDDESWYSAVPEAVGQYAANLMKKRLGSGKKLTLMDGMSGCGGSLLQLASVSETCIGNEYDSEKIPLLENNISVYKRTNIDVMNEDFLDIPGLVKDKKVDGVFLSPPWGGINYKELLKYNFEYITPNINSILEATFSMTPNLMLHIPKNTCLYDIAATLAHHSDGSTVIFEADAVSLGRSPNIHVLQIYTGKLAQVSSVEIAESMLRTHIRAPTGEEFAAKKELGALIESQGL